MKKMSVPVPQQLKNGYFFDNGEVELAREELFQLSAEKLFIYEMAYFQHITCVKPWEMRHESIPLILKEWSQVKGQLDRLFQNRDLKQVSHLMRKGVGLFIQFLHWSNGLPVVLNPCIPYEKLKMKPVNLEERLDFVLSRPDIYPSYKQLIELMTEMEKQYERSKAIQQQDKSV